MSLGNGALTRYKEAVSKVQIARNEAMKVFEQSFPIGSRIVWKRGAYNQTGKVLRHCYDQRLAALNDKTGREVFVEGYNIRDVSDGEG